LEEVERLEVLLVLVLGWCWAGAGLVLRVSVGGKALVFYRQESRMNDS